MNCPGCGEACDREEIDVGVGVIQGPWGCFSCGWSEFNRAAAEAAHPGYWCSPTGILHPIDGIVERCEHFGIDGDAVREAFESRR